MLVFPPLHGTCLLYCGFHFFLLMLSPTLTLSLLSWSGALDRQICSFFFRQRTLWRTCQLLSLWHWDHSFLFSMPSMFKFFRWSLRHSACSLLVSAAPSSLPLLFSSYLTLVLSSPPCPFPHLSFHLKLCGRSGRNCLLSPSVLSGYNGYTDTRLSRGTTQLMIWPDKYCYLSPSQSHVVLSPCSLRPLIARIHSCLFSHWRRTVSIEFFATQVPSVSTEELLLPRHARCVLSRLRCNGHSLLLSSYLYRIGRIWNPFCSASKHSSQNTSHLILRRPATDSLATLCLSTTSGQGPGVLTVFLGPIVFRHAPIPRKGWGNNNNVDAKHNTFVVAIKIPTVSTGLRVRNYYILKQLSTSQIYSALLYYLYKKRYEWYYIC